MLYKFLLFPARIFLHLYCRRVIINKKEITKLQGPLLIAANHPNSFLDAIILATLFKNPIHSLARGDAFAGKLITRILASLNMLPVYRVSEGVENLEQNYETFDACQNIFKQNGIVLIFSEGRCINEWRLRALKKGTARLAMAAWKHGIPLKVIPLGINYSAFRTYGKTVILNFGSVISKEEMQEDISSGKTIIAFNQKLKHQLEKLVIGIEKDDKQKRKQQFYFRQPFIKKALLFFPAIAGLLIHAPLYALIHLVINKKAEDHYDSIFIGLLFFIYPLYVLILSLASFFILKSVFVLWLLALIPFTLWSYVQFSAKI
ncbi:MAG: 1-acyl-sn-glycerol-3-phosphate acyltransferase [Ginsengibacter sp.]